MLGRKVRKASWIASDCELALLETRMPMESETIGERKERKNKNVAVNGNLKDEAHEGENQAQFGKTDAEIGKKLAAKKTHRADGSDEKLFKGAALLFAD